MPSVTAMKDNMNITPNTTTTHLTSELTPPGPHSDKLADLARVACTTGVDPELDGLLVRFHHETAACPRGAVELTAGALDRQRQTVQLVQEDGRRIEAPITLALMERMIAHCERRTGGCVSASTPVFRFLDGSSLNRRHYTALARRWQAHLAWAAETGVGIRWVRQVVLIEVDQLCGNAVASRMSGSTRSATDRCFALATIEDLAQALTLRFGEVHPLAAGR